MELTQFSSENESKEWNNNENNNLITKNYIINDNNDPLLPDYNAEKKNLFIRFLKAPLLFLFYLFIFMIVIIEAILYLIIYIKNENFYIFQIPWENSYLNDRKYQNYQFDNGLEIMLIQDNKFDMDGGAIIINKGYMDNPQEEGIYYLSVLILNQIFTSKNNELLLSNYFGSYVYDINEHYTTFKFNILNSGFKKYLEAFSLILNINNNLSSYLDEYFNGSELFNNSLDIMHSNYINKGSINEKENHLLEYFVYGFKDANNCEIFPEGNNETILKYDSKYLKNKTLNYIQKIINPKNIKIVLFSKYKFLITAKYMKKYFQYLIDKKSEDSNVDDINFEKSPFFNNKFNTSQIFYIKSHRSEMNYIKIIYFIDKIKNETYSELYHKIGYFNYITDILSETKEGSLYSLLTRNSTFNVMSIVANYELILKSRIKFYIEIQLNCLKNINDIIFITYQYMNKIIQEGIGDNMQIDRYIELKNLANQTLRYMEKTFDTMELAKNNGINLFDTKYRQDLFFYPFWLPWEKNMTNDENIKNIKNES